MNINIKKTILDFFSKRTFLFWSFVAVTLGVLTGLLLGERCRNVEIIGSLYISFMQWIIVPFFFISIIYSLGRFAPKQFWQICKYGVLTYLFGYIIFFAIFIALPYTFPNWRIEHFITTDTPSYVYEGFNVSELLFLNPIKALAENQIVAVVVFCTFFGILLQQHKSKQALLDQLGIIDNILFKITNLVTKVTPVGLYFIVAYSAGTITVKDFVGLQVYIAMMVIINLLLYFVIGPITLMLFTPFKYKEILKAAAPATLTALLTSNKIIAIPFIHEAINKLLSKHNKASVSTKYILNIILPILIIIPSVPKLTSYIFILYSAWINNIYLTFFEHTKMYLLTIISGFASAKIGIPFILSQFKLPADMFNLFVICDAVFMDKFRTGCEIMAIFVCAALIIIFYNRLAFMSSKSVIDTSATKRRKLLSIMILISAIILFASNRFYNCLPKPESNIQILDQMQVKEKVQQVEFSKLRKPEKAISNNLFNEIKKRKVLRVGFVSSSIPPLIFRNNKGKLSGYDVQLAHFLAKDFGCTKIEYYPVKVENFDEALNNRQVDMIISDFYVNNERILKAAFTSPYRESKQVLLVSDSLNSRLHVVPQLLDSPQFRIATKKYFDDASFKRDFPNAQNIKIKNINEFFNNPNLADATYVSNEIAIAYCIRKPEYGIFDNIPNRSYPVSIAVPYDEDILKNYLDNWIDYNKSYGTFNTLRDYWILGKSVVKKQYRRCLIPYDWSLRKKSN